MSAASRAREALRRAEAYSARYLASHPDWGTFRAWQAEMLSRWCGPSQPFETRPTRALMRGERPVPAGEILLVDEPFDSTSALLLSTINHPLFS